MSGHLPVIHPYSLDSLGALLPTVQAAGLTAAARTLWGTANLARFYPVYLSTPEVITKLFVVNGNPVGGNFDVGFYTKDFRLMASSGSTVQAGNDVIQSIDIADFAVGPGLYYFACAMSLAAGNVEAVPSVAAPLRSCGAVMQAAAFPLPAVAAPALTTDTNVYLFGALLAPRTVI